MITKSEAEALVREHLRKIETPDIPFAVNEVKTVERSFGWVFFYNSKQFLDTRDIRFRLAGNGPIAVKRSSGELATLGTHKPAQALIDEFEKQCDLKGVI
jgi:hypothetical protein